MNVRVQCRLLLLAAAAGALCSCAKHAVAPGIEPTPKTGFFERRHQVRLPAQKAECALIFVGGFAEQVLAHTRNIYETMPPLPMRGRQLRAFYAWDGAQGWLFSHHTRLLQGDLRAFLRINPKAKIVFIGHSYGASAVMDALRELGPDVPRGRVVVVTLDPVSKRERSHPRERAQGVDYWINVYCEPYRHGKDIFAAIGGPWRHCPQADVNLRFSGKERDSRGRRYQHSWPEALLEERPNAQSFSASEYLDQACRAFDTTP